LFTRSLPSEAGVNGLPGWSPGDSTFCSTALLRGHSPVSWRIVDAGGANGTAITTCIGD